MTPQHIRIARLKKYQFASFDEPKVIERTSQTHIEGPDGATPRFDVLLVDDSIDALNEMSEALTQVGLNLASASHPSAALKWLRSNRVAVIVSDIRMPGISGLMMASLIRGDFREDAPELIFISGYADRDTVIQALRHSPQDFLLKPLDIEQLLSSVFRALNAHGARAGTPTTARSEGGPSEVHEGGHKRATYDVQPAPLMQLPALRRPNVLRLLQRERDIRAEIFDADIASSAAWQIIIDLYAMGQEQGHNYVSSVAVGSQVPLTTALRHIDHLVQEQLIERSRDPADARRVRIKLTERCNKLVDMYLAKLTSDPVFTQGIEV